MLPHGTDVPEVKRNFPSVERAGLHQYLITLGEELYMFSKVRKGIVRALEDIGGLLSFILLDQL